MFPAGAVLSLRTETHTHTHTHTHMDAKRQADMTKQIVAFRSFATAPTNEHLVRQLLIAGYWIAR